MTGIAVLKVDDLGRRPLLIGGVSGIVRIYHSMILYFVNHLISFTSLVILDDEKCYTCYFLGILIMPHIVLTLCAPEAMSSNNSNCPKKKKKRRT